MSASLNQSKHLRDAGGYVSVDSDFGEPHDGPAKAGNVFVSERIALGIMPVRAINFDREVVRCNGEVHPISADVMLGCEGDSGVGQGKPHRSFNASFVSLLRNNVARVLFRVIGIEPSQSFRLRRHFHAASRSGERFDFSSKPGFICRFLATPPVAPNVQARSLGIVQWLHPLVFPGTVSDVSAVEGAVIPRLVFIGSEDEFGSANITSSASPLAVSDSATGIGAVFRGATLAVCDGDRKLGPANLTGCRDSLDSSLALARPRTVLAPTACNDIGLDGKGGAAVLAHSRNASASLVLHVLDLLDRSRAAVPGLFPVAPGVSIVPKTTHSCGIQWGNSVP